VPIVRIELTDENVTREQKRQLVQGVTDLLHDVMNKHPERIYVLIDEVAVDNWGGGGLLVSERRAGGFDGICDCGQHEAAKEAMKPQLVEYGYRPEES